jgi:hypothetical protein
MIHYDSRKKMGQGHYFCFWLKIWQKLRVNGLQERSDATAIPSYALICVGCHLSMTKVIRE